MAAQESLNHKIFELIFDQNREMLERLAYFYVGSAEEAQDIVSQSFLTLWERREEVVSDRVLPYLFTIVKNACLDYRRKEEKHRQVREQIYRQERAMMDIYTSTIESRDPIALFTGEILHFNDRTRRVPLHEGEIVYLEAKKNESAPNLDKHVVEAGETMRDLAQRYAVKMKKLYKYNAMMPGTEPEPGTILLLRKPR